MIAPQRVGPTPNERSAGTAGAVRAAGGTAARSALPDLTAVGLSPAERTRCEVWTRVMGYHRPLAAWNAGTRAEHAARRHFTEAAAGLTHA